MKLAFVMDPISKIAYKKDSTLAMMIEAQQSEHEIYYVEPHDLYFDMEIPSCITSSISVQYEELEWFQKDTPFVTGLDFFDVILMRQDPPFDMNYVNNTYILEAALNLGVKVFNNPAALRDDNEKLSILRYPNLITQTIVSSSKSIIEKFINNHNEVVIKPLGLMGGQGIERIKLGDKNLDNLLNKISEKQEKMMIQKFIPEVFEGDKRVLLIDGEDCGFAVSRIPQGDDFRGNLAAGGKAEVVELNERDKEIIQSIKPDLEKKGIMIAGIDILGNYLTEINITRPTGFRELMDIKEINLAKKLIEKIESNFNG